LAAVRNDALLRAMPAVFVFIWSTGFIVARFGMPHAPPFSFLTLRYVLSALCFALWIGWSKARWPQGRWQWIHLAVTGVLMHAGYLGGVWAAVKLGLGAGTVSLLVGLQPVLTAIWLSASSGAGTRRAVSSAQWLGLLFGLAGLMLVVSGKLGAGEVRPANLALAIAALLSITTGTLYQKRFVAACDVRTASAVQLAAAFLFTLPLALMETEALHWRAPLLGAMAWSVLGLTLGGSSLLYLLIQRGAATRVTSLLYLVPPTTAVMAWLIFGETLTAPMMLGMALTAIGVALVVRQPVD
jgi:drug/metabolite transporter (DMT)-like permease